MLNINPVVDHPLILALPALRVNSVPVLIGSLRKESSQSCVDTFDPLNILKVVFLNEASVVPGKATRQQT